MALLAGAAVGIDGAWIPLRAASVRVRDGRAANAGNCRIVDAGHMSLVSRPSALARILESIADTIAAP